MFKNNYSMDFSIYKKCNIKLICIKYIKVLTLNMSFSCDKCKKVFKRQLHLDQYMNRKIPCNREIMCLSCGKEFELLGNLKQHLSKKFKCQDIREVLHLQIQLKDKEIQLEEVKLKISNNDKITKQINGEHIIMVIIIIFILMLPII